MFEKNENENVVNQKTQRNQANALSKKESFEFVVTVGDNIVCQRYFRVGNYNETSLSSRKVLNAVRDCGNLIIKLLESKTRKYLHLTAPQIFNSVDQAVELMRKHPNWVKANDYVYIKDTETLYQYYNDILNPSTSVFNHMDYLRCDYVENEITPCIFTFKYEGRTIGSMVIDMSPYPQFIRTNLDLTSSKNRYKNTDKFNMYYTFLLDSINEGREDLVPVIVEKLSRACSFWKPAQKKTKE